MGEDQRELRNRPPALNSQGRTIRVTQVRAKCASLARVRDWT